LIELLRPWKLATLAGGLGLLIAGSRLMPAPDWDIPVCIIMAGVTYVSAPWCMRALLDRQWRRWPAMLLLTWFAVDGCYAAYWGLVDPRALELMRAANAPASLSLFMMCGLLWLPRVSLSEIASAAFGLPRLSELWRRLRRSLLRGRPAK
jgi:hypothetical protein